MKTQSHHPQTPAVGDLKVRVVDKGGSHARAEHALVEVYRRHGQQAEGKKADEKFDVTAAKQSAHWCLIREGRTGADGCVSFEQLEAGEVWVAYRHYPATEAQSVTVRAGCVTETCVEPLLGIERAVQVLDQNCEPLRCARPRVRDRISIAYALDQAISLPEHGFIEPPPGFVRDSGDPSRISGRALQPGPLHATAHIGMYPIGAVPGPEAMAAAAIFSDTYEDDIDEPPVQQIGGQLGVALSRTATEPTADTSFFRALLNSTEGLSFNTYLRFMDKLFCGENGLDDLPGFERDRFDLKGDEYVRLRRLRRLPFTDSDAYRVVKAATEAFVMVNCGVLAEPQPFDAALDNAYLQRRDLPVPVAGLQQVFGADYLKPVVGGDVGARTLPYLAVIRSKLPDIAIKLSPIEAAPEVVSKCHGILQDKLDNPCLIELIWSYWHEEGMLVQTMNAIARRFQNVRANGRDPLANLEIDPLRPLNNILWGYVQDEQHRLSVVRRNYEYDHHYGLRLEGKVVQRMQAADSRSRFLEAFHNLLRLCAVFFKQDDDTTVKADAFPVLNALKEVHLILSQGAHNQFGDLPSTARIEMLMQQWMLARPEFREFLPTRIMTAYPEPWMDRVDAMKKLQGWTDTSVLHFRNLAMFGEQILLTIRWGHWSDVQEPLQAFNWARLLRPQIQGYSHAYRAVTGVDLTGEMSDTRVDATLPSVLLQRRLAAQLGSA